MIKVTINNICAKLTECEPLTSGMIGKLVEVSFSSEWDSLNKIAVFSNGDVTKDLYESQWNGNYIPIPQEVLATPYRTISMGIYGYELVDGEKVLAIPTIVAEIGKTKFGADPSNDPAADPTLPIWAQLQWEIDHFEIDEQQIAEQVQEYLETHPIGIEPATATRLGGVKVGDGLSVTDDGTLSADAPDLSEYAKTEDVDELANIVDGKQDEIADLDEIRAGAELGATAVQPEAGKGLFSGNYNDLSNKPTLFSGNYNDLTNKPTIPTVPQNVSAFSNDSGYLTLSTLPIYDGSVI